MKKIEKQTMTQSPTNLCFVFPNPRQTLRRGTVSFPVGRKGPVFHGLAQQRHVFADAESVRATRDAGGQVLGQCF